MIGDLKRLFEVVGDIDDRHALGGQVADDLEQDLNLRRRQGAGRLVHDQDAAVHRQGAGDFHDLLLAKAQLLDRGQRVDLFLQTLHQDLGLTLFLGEIDAGGAHDLAPHEDVVTHRKVGGEAQLLVDDRDATIARLGRIGEGDRLAVQHDLARGRLNHARKDLHQRRLARAVLAEKRRHLPAMDVEIHALQRLNGAIGLRHIARGQNDLTRIGPGCGGVGQAGHFTSIRTGVIIQFFGLIRRKAPTTSTVLPVSAAVSRPSRIAAFIARLMPEPAS